MGFAGPGSRGLKSNICTEINHSKFLLDSRLPDVELQVVQVIEPDPENQTLQPPVSKRLGGAKVSRGKTEWLLFSVLHGHEGMRYQRYSEDSELTVQHCFLPIEF